MEPAGAQARENLQPAAPGQAKIQQNRVERLGGGPEIPILPGPGHDNVVGLSSEARFHRPGHLRVVFDDEHTHAADLQFRLGRGSRPSSRGSAFEDTQGVTYLGMKIP
jgi:hypothetical protein